MDEVLEDVLADTAFGRSAGRGSRTPTRSNVCCYTTFSKLDPIRCNPRTCILRDGSSLSQANIRSSDREPRVVLRHVFVNSKPGTFTFPRQRINKLRLDYGRLRHRGEWLAPSLTHPNQYGHSLTRYGRIDSSLIELRPTDLLPLQTVSVVLRPGGVKVALAMPQVFAVMRWEQRRL